MRGGRLLRPLVNESHGAGFGRDDKVGAGGLCSDGGDAEGGEVVGEGGLDAGLAGGVDGEVGLVIGLLHDVLVDETCDQRADEYAICPPPPIFISTLWMVVPSGIRFSGSALPGRMSALAAEMTVSPTLSTFAGPGTMV